MEGRLRLFAFFPYLLALALIVLAQTFMWSYDDLGDSPPHLIFGLIVWSSALVAVGLGDRALHVLVRGGDPPWEKTQPGPLDRLLLLCLTNLGIFLSFVAVMTLMAVSLPIL